MAQNFSRKTTLKKKVVLEGNCNSPQLQIVAVMSKTLRRGVYKCDFSLLSPSNSLIGILF